MSNANEDPLGGEGTQREITRGHRTRHDWSEPEPLGTTIVRAVAAVTGREPTDMEPLHETVDADALDNLFAPRSDEESRASEAVLRFSYCGQWIQVFGDGLVIITPGEN